MFKQRLLSGIVLVLIMIATLYFGGYVTWGMVLVISLIGVNELLKLENISRKLIGLASYLGAAGYLILTMLYGNKYTVVFLIGFLLVLMIIYVFSYPAYTFTQVMMSFVSVVYVTIMLGCIYQVRELSHGGILVALVFFSAWGNDTCAYCVGVLFGKHKMSPKLSPKKSVEGLIGGIVGATLIGAGYGAIMKQYMDVSYNPVLLFALICGVGGFISVVGDLSASAIKRQYGIKDYSRLIPGHGGIMDRFDSIIFTAPIVYYLVYFVM